MKSSWEEAPQLKSPWWSFSPSTLLKSRTRRNVGIFHVHSNQIPSYPLVYKLRWFAALYISEIFLEPFSESETSAMIIVYFSRHTETYYTLWYGVVTPIGRLVLLLLLLWLQWYFQQPTITNIGRLVLLLWVSFFPETINTGRHLCCCVIQHHFTRYRAGKSCCEEWLKILRYKHPLTKTLGLESIFWKGLFSIVFSLFYKIGQKVIWTGYKIGHFLISFNFLFGLSVSQLCRWFFGNFTQPEISLYEQGLWKQCCTNFLKAKCMNDIKNPIEGLWKYLESMSNTVLKAIFGQIIFFKRCNTQFYIYTPLNN